MAKFILSAFADEAGSSLAEQIDALHGNGISYIEPRNIDGKCIIDYSEDELAAIKAELDKNGIRVSSVGSPIGKFPIHEPYEVHEVAFKNALRTAKALGTKYIRMFSFFVKQDELADCRDEVLARLRRMVADARAEGITLCHENESDIYGQMPAEVCDLLEEIPDLYGIFDPANYVVNGADPMEGIRATFKHFRYMHVKDAFFDPRVIVPSGEGEGHIPEILSLIDAHTDDTVFLTVEPHLHMFDAFKLIDKHELKGKYEFKTQREAFDCACQALIGILESLGFKKGEDNVWKK